MDFNLILQDPLVVLELVAVATTFLFIAKLTLQSGQQANSSDEIEHRCNQTRRSSNPFSSYSSVGSLISLPKRSLAQQSLSVSCYR